MHKVPVTRTNGSQSRGFLKDLSCKKKKSPVYRWLFFLLHPADGCSFFSLFGPMSSFISCPVTFSLFCCICRCACSLPCPARSGSALFCIWICVLFPVRFRDGFPIACWDINKTKLSLHLFLMRFCCFLFCFFVFWLKLFGRTYLKNYIKNRHFPFSFLFYSNQKHLQRIISD